MPTTDSIFARTKADFNAELVCTSGDAALFAALRKGGNKRVSTPNGPWQSHVMGVWHFVVIQGTGSFRQISQWHIPRYEMATALRVQDHFFQSQSYPEPIFATYMPLPTNIHGRNKLEFLLCGSDPGFHLPQSFVLQLKKDLPLLEKARKTVRENNDLFCIPTLETPAGHPVQSSSEALLDAIAFEKATYPRITAANFGIYSAFSTYRDSPTSIHMPDSLIRELLEAQDDPEDLPDEIQELFLATQRRLLSKPIWGRGLGINETAPILAEGMASLTRTQRVQFMLMNGMHGGGLFLPLATILGLCDFEFYAHHTCRAWQPDSPEEQDLRKETAYIKLYGQLAAV